MDKNAGTLEKWWAIRLATLKAQLYALFHWQTKVTIENRWVEERGPAPPYALFTYDCDVCHYREEITFIGVSRGNWRDGTFEIVRWYYGNPRFDTNLPAEDRL